MSNEQQLREALEIGGKYKWKGQPERLVYLGNNWSGNGYWHQFALETEPGKVWCECLPSDLHMIEKTALSQPMPEAAPTWGKLIEAHSSASKYGLLAGTSNWAAHVQQFLSTSPAAPEGAKPLPTMVDKKSTNPQPQAQSATLRQCANPDSAGPEGVKPCNYPDCKCPTETPCLQGRVQPQAQPLLVRDLAEIIGKTVPEVSAVIVNLGLGNRSTNMELHPDEAIAVAKHFDQPQAQGWKDGDTAKLVNDLRDVAVQFRDAEQLRERIAHVIRPLTYRLSASPEAPAAAHDDAALQALGWQRISCPVCGADGARAAPQQAAQVAQPLTEEQVHRLHGFAPGTAGARVMSKLVRDTEAAHGIGKDQG